MMGRYGAGVAAVFLLFSVSSVSLSAERGASQPEKPKEPPTVDELVEFFDTVVFRSEIPGVAASTGIKKWVEPLRVAIRTFEEVTVEQDGRDVVRLRQVKAKAPHVRFIKKHLTTLVTTAGLKTEDANKTGKPPNFMINFVPRNQMANPNVVDADPKLLRRLASEGGCFFLIWSNSKTGELEKAVIVVNAERLLIRINHCLLEEMIQSLGLPNDTNLITPSIFADGSRRTELSRSDKIILKALYDPRLKPGMRRDDALAMARKVIIELDAGMP